MAIPKFDDLQLNEFQLKFQLPEFDETAEDAEERFISPEEARRISEAARKLLEAQASIGPKGKDGLRPKEPAWFREYMNLIEQGYPWRVACYMAWASSPKIGRWPESIEKLATDILGLKSARVIYTWRKKRPKLDTLVGMLQGAPLWEHRRDVLDALATMAMQPDYKAHNDRKLFLELTGDYVPRSLVGLGKASADGGLAEMSDSELRRWAGDSPTPSPSPFSKYENGEETSPTPGPSPFSKYENGEGEEEEDAE